MCLLNVKDVCNIQLKGFCDETCRTGLLLKKIGGRVRIETHVPL